MEENHDNSVDEQKQENTVNSFNISAEDIKKETEETVKQVKDTLKTTDIKKDSTAAKGFFIEFFKNPIEQIKKCANDSKSIFLKTTIIIFVVWIISILLREVIGIANQYLFGTLGSFSYFFKHLLPNIFDIIKALIAPIIGIILLSGLTYGFKKNKNKSFLTILSTVIIANIPVVIANIVNLLAVLNNNIVKITNCFSSFCSTLYVVLLYFAIKALSDESESKNYFWKFALIIGIYYVARFILTYLDIYI